MSETAAHMPQGDENTKPGRRLNSSVLRDHGDIIGHGHEVDQGEQRSRKRILRSTNAETASVEPKRVFTETENQAREKHFGTNEEKTESRTGKRILTGPASSHEVKKVKLSKEREGHEKKVFGSSSVLPMTNDENFFNAGAESARPVTSSRAARLKNMSSSNIFSDMPEIAPTDIVKTGKKMHTAAPQTGGVAEVLREV